MGNGGRVICAARLTTEGHDGTELERHRQTCRARRRGGACGDRRPGRGGPADQHDDDDRRVAEPGASSTPPSPTRSPSRPPWGLRSGLTGTVSLDVSGAPIAGCQSLPLTNGAATCQGPAGSTADYRRVDADYSGDGAHAFSTGFDYLAVIAPATVTPSVTPNPVLRLAPITYKATVAGISLGGAIVPAVANFGTMAYFVDDQPVTACAAQPVDYTFKSSCPSLAPPVGGTHVLKTVYSGSHYAGPNVATTNFVVLAPAATLPETVDFASVTVGAGATRTVTLTNSGSAPLQVGGAHRQRRGLVQHHR